MHAALPRSDYYEGSATSSGRQPTMDLPVDRLVVGREGRPEDASHVRCVPLDGDGIELYPDSLTTRTPQAFRAAFRTRPTAWHERGAAID